MPHRLFWVFLAIGSCFFAGAGTTPQPCSIERIAGGGSIITGAGGPALEAEILDAADARVGPDGLLYIADRAQDVIWRVLGDSTIELFAGTGASGSSGDEGPATQALLDGPESLAFGPDGSLFIFSGGDYLIRRIDPGGVIHAFAGDGIGLHSQNLYTPGMSAAELPLASDTTIATGPAGEVYATLPFQHRVVRINQDGTVDPFAGRSADWIESGVLGDGGPAVDALLTRPAGVAVDSSGQVYIADRENDRIRRVRSDGTIELFAGPDHRLADVAHLEADSADRIYYSRAYDIGRISTGGQYETIYANNALPQSRFTVGPDGSVYVLWDHQALKIDPANASVMAFAGRGPTAGLGDGGPALNARFISARGLAVGLGGEVFVADYDANRVRIIRTSGTIDALAGTGTAGFSGDGGPAAAAQLHRPGDLAVGLDGSLLVADEFNSRIRRVDSGGGISTFAGNGFPGCTHDFSSNQCGDDGPAVDAAVPRPQRIVVGPEGAVHILDRNSQRRPIGADSRQWLRRISTAGIITTAPFVTLAGAGNTAGAETLAVRPDGRVLTFASASASPPAESFLILDYSSAEAAFSADENLNAYLERRPSATAFSPDGTLYAAYGPSLRRVAPDGSINLLLRPEGFAAAGPAPIIVGGNDSITDIAVGPDGDLYLLIRQQVHRLHVPDACNLEPRPEIAVQGVRHGATFAGPRASFVPLLVAPGQIVAIFGRRLGPEQLAGGQVSGGFVTTETGGVRVLVGGQPAPMLYASAGQVAAIIPYGTSADGARSLQVEVDGVLSEPRDIQLVDANPGIFTLDSSGQGPGAILNQDGSLNTTANPARAGEVIVLWATGEGQTNPPGVDGLIADGALPQPVLPVKASIDFVEAQVLYAGASPGLVAGAMQINLIVPSGLSRSGALGLTLQVGDVSTTTGATAPVTVFVAP